MDAEFLHYASKCLKCPADRVQLIEDSSKFDPTAIKDGVVVYLALWSAFAQGALKIYTEKLSQLEQDVPVWILNVDTLNDHVDAQFVGSKQGYGETFFFRDGIQVEQLLGIRGNYAAEFLDKWHSTFGA